MNFFFKGNRGEILSQIGTAIYSAWNGIYLWFLFQGYFITVWYRHRPSYRIKQAQSWLRFHGVMVSWFWNNKKVLMPLSPPIPLSSWQHFLLHFSNQKCSWCKILERGELLFKEWWSNPLWLFSVHGGQTGLWLTNQTTESDLESFSLWQRSGRSMPPNTNWSMCNWASFLKQRCFWLFLQTDLHFSSNFHCSHSIMFPWYYEWTCRQWTVTGFYWWLL